MEASTFISIIERGEGLQDRPAGLHTMGTGPNPLTIMTFLHGNRTIGQGNCGYYNNDKVNELLDQVIASNDEEEITQAIKDIQAEVQKDCALINLWNKWRTFAYDTDFKNMESVWPFSWVTGLSSVWWSGGSTEKPGEPTPTPEARIPMEYFAETLIIALLFLNTMG
jgi:ABC-type transport system substrate-binding protein